MGEGIFDMLDSDMYHAYQKAGMIEYGGPTNYITLPNLSDLIGMPALWNIF